MPQKERPVDMAVKNAVMEAYLWDQRFAAVSRWAGEARMASYSPSIRWDDLAQAMLAKSQSAWRRAFMWGLVSPEHRKDIQREAASRFLDVTGERRLGIMHHLDPQNRLPGHWQVAAEEEFRKEILALVAPLLKPEDLE